MQRKKPPSELTKMSKEKKELARKIIILAGAGIFAAAFAILFAAKYLIPAPLAEFAAFSYVYVYGGKTCYAALLIAASAASLVSLALSALSKGKARLIASIVSVVFLSADFVLHSYAFIAAGGYQWNYLISAILDSAVAVCVLYKPKEAEK